MPSPGLWQFGLGPPGIVLQEELESVQKRAARFVTGNYNYETGSMTGILGQLKWESLKKRRKDNRLIIPPAYLTNHSSESIHIWTIGTLEGRLSFQDSSPQGPCPGVGLEVKI